MSETLFNKSCTPCQGGMPPLTADEAEQLHAAARDWTLRENAHRLEREFKFRNFRDALNFVVQVGAIAESERHHPDVRFGWGYALISLQTKKLKGLHENDFIMASKIDRAFDQARMIGIAL